MISKDILNKKNIICILKIVLITIIILLIIYFFYYKNKYELFNKIDIKYESFNNIEIKPKTNLVFTSAGDNTQFYNHWLGETRNYDVWCVYYGKNENIYNMYDKLVDKIWKRKGSKFQNFHYIYTNYRHLLDIYDRFFIVDDDIIISTNDINRLFEISIKYDLWVCQPSFTRDDNCKISHPITMHLPNNLLRYTNFVEVNTPVFSKDSIHKFMKYYDPILIGYGIDFFYIWVLGLDKDDKYAIIDSIQCINPIADKKAPNTVREHNNITNYDKEDELWFEIQNKYNIPDWIDTKTYSIILESNENKINNIKLAIQTVLIMKENLPFLREWIIYHLHIGFDKIFLYDNTGSVGIDDSTKEVNKYAFNFNTIINMNNNLIDSELQAILNDFKDNVIYDKWQPKNENGEIIYGQEEAIKDYIKKYGKLTDYTAFIDTDEFIFSEKNVNLKEYVYNSSKDDISKIVLIQKKFNDRFCNRESKNISEISNTIENIDTYNWANKVIIKNSDINLEKIESVHILETVRGKSIDVAPDIFRFNHYNVNKKQINWMKDFYNKQNIDEFEYKQDTSMNRYTNIINNKCNNKCSKTNNFVKYDEITKDFDTLCVTKW